MLLYCQFFLVYENNIVTQAEYKQSINHIKIKSSNLIRKLMELNICTLRMSTTLQFINDNE